MDQCLSGGRAQEKTEGEVKRHSELSKDIDEFRL